MMEIFEILSNLIISVSIFSKMGTGSQSGKLLFKSIYSGDNISIQSGLNTLTVSNTFYQNPILLNTVVMGTGDNITSSLADSPSGGDRLKFKRDASYNSFLYNLYIIQNFNSTFSYSASGKNPYSNCDEHKTNVTKGGCGLLISGNYNLFNKGTDDNQYNTLIVSGSNNRIGGGRSSVILSGFGNSMKVPNQIVFTENGGVGNRESSSLNFGNPQNSAIISGEQNTILNGLNSVEISGIKNYMGGNVCNSMILSGFKNKISSTASYNGAKVTDGVTNTTIISSYKTCISQGFKNSAILDSSCSCLILSDLSDCVCGNLIISALCGQIVGTSTVTLFEQRNHNSIISGSKNRIYNSNYSSIIGGLDNKLCLHFQQSNSFFNFNTIVSGVSSSISRGNFAASTQYHGYSTIIGSYKSKLDSVSKFTEIFNVAIVGGECNCTHNDLENTSFQFSSIIAGKCNILVSDTNFFAGCRVSTSIIAGRGNTSSGISIAGTLNRTISDANKETDKAITIGGGGGGKRNVNECGLIINSYESTSNQSQVIGSKCVSTDVRGLKRPDISVHISGYRNKTDCNCRTSMLGGRDNRAYSTKDSIIMVGCCNCMIGPTSSDSNRNNFILGGQCNKFCSDLAAGFSKFSGEIYQSGIIGGCCNTLYRGGVPKPDGLINNTVILGGCGLTSSDSNSAVMQNLWVTGTLSTGSTLHFTQSFTYSIDGITGLYLNPSNIRYVNGIVVAIDGQKVDYTKKLQFEAAPSAPVPQPPAFTFSVSQVTSPEILVQWGDTRSATFSGSSITTGITYSSLTNRTVTVFGTFSGFTGSNPPNYGQIVNINDYGSVSRITVTGSFFFGGSGNFNTSAFDSVNNWQYINFSRNSFTVANVNSILIHLDSLPVGTVTDVLLFSQSTLGGAVPTGLGSASRAQLLSEGVNVITDWPY